MADDVSQPIITTTKYWEFHHPSSHCQSSTNAIPWLICIIALTAAWTFLLGATDIRRRLRNRYGRFAEPWGFSPQIVAIFGSLFLQLAMTLAMAQILRGPPHPATSRNSFGMALGVWMIRPLPACVVSVISFMSLSTYQANAMEIQATELLYGLGAGYFYVDINRKVQVASAVLKQPQVSGAAAAPTVTNTLLATVSISIVPTSTVGIPALTTSATTSPGGLVVSPDRTCGSKGRFTCLGSSWGSCCSVSGYCGSESDYCTGGCQPDFGTCDPPSRRRDTFTDRACGVGSGASCLGSQWGNCCSAFSLCGGNETYCGEGCQPEFGECSVTAPPPISLVSGGVTDARKFLTAMRVGAVLGLIVWVLSLAFVLALCLLRWTSFPVTSESVHRLQAFCVFLSLGRIIVGFLLWSSALKLDPGAFCPNERTVTGVTVLWAFVPALDHFWRALY